MAEYLSEEDMNTGEYISRDLALKQLNATCLATDCDNYNGVRCRACAYADAMDFINAIPAVDVQPVKRGRWIETHISLCKWIPEDEKEEGHSFYMAELKCSCCERYNAVTFALTLNKPDFCQLCGARMDGEQNEND